MTLRDKISNTIESAKFKANQQLRIQDIKTERSKLVSSISYQHKKIVDAVLELHEEGKLKDKSLADICASIDDLDAQIQVKDEEIEAVRAETGPQLQICENCGNQVPSVADFCPDCGQKVTKDIGEKPEEEKESD